MKKKTMQILQIVYDNEDIKHELEGKQKQMKILLIIC